MNIIVRNHPDKSPGVKASSLIYYKLSIIDSVKSYLHYQSEDKTTLEKLNALLQDIKDTGSGSYIVSLSLSFFNEARDYINCMFISEESDLMNIWNKEVDKGNIWSSVGPISYQGSVASGSPTVLYLITEEQAKTDIDWQSQKENYDLETLLAEINDLETLLVTGRQKLEDKKKLSAEVIFIQSGISETEQSLTKVDVGTLSNLYTAYLSLSKTNMTPALRSKYNAMLEIQRNWNILAKQLGLEKIVDKNAK